MESDSKFLDRILFSSTTLTHDEWQRLFTLARKGAAADAGWKWMQEQAALVAETPIETLCCNNPLWSGDPEDQPECCGKPEYRWGDPGEIAAAIRALPPPPEQEKV